MPSHAIHPALLQVTRALHVAKSADHFSVLISWDLVGADDLMDHSLHLEILLSLGFRTHPLPAFHPSSSCSFSVPPFDPAFDILHFQPHLQAPALSELLSSLTYVIATHLTTGLPSAPLVGVSHCSSQTDPVKIGQVGDFPDGPVLDSKLPLQRAWVLSLVWEPRSPQNKDFKQWKSIVKGVMRSLSLPSPVVLHHTACCALQ